MTRSRFFRIAFVAIACISLLINAAVIGFGIHLKNRGIIGGGLGAAWTEIPRETRQLVRESLKAESANLRQLREELRENRKRMMAIAAVDPVDTQALDAAMVDVREATMRLQQAAHSSILQSLREDLKPEN